jgi:hypothetical protein
MEVLVGQLDIKSVYGLFSVNVLLPLMLILSSKNGCVNCGIREHRLAHELYAEKANNVRSFQFSIEDNNA